MSINGRNKGRLYRAATLGFAAFFACAYSSHADDQKKVVSYLSWTPAAINSEKMKVATEKQLPGVQINLRLLDIPEYLVSMAADASSGEMADIVGLEPGALTQQYRSQLMPMQQCAERHWGKDWKSKFFPIGVEQARLGNPKDDENFYGLPVLLQTINFYTIDPVMKEAGLQPPKTYDDLLKASKVLQEKGYAPLLAGLSDGWLRRDIYMELINNISPGLIYKAENGDAKFTEQPFVDAMKWWKKFFDDGIFQPGALGIAEYPNAADLIEGGRAGMFPNGSWWMQEATRDSPSDFASGLQGFTPIRFPDVTGKGVTTEVLGGIDLMVGISKNSKNPDAACDVVADWISGAGAQKIIDLFQDIPAWKGINPTTFTSEHQKEIWRLFTEDWMPSVKYARQLKSPAVKQALENALAAVGAGEMKPEDAMATIQEAAESK